MKPEPLLTCPKCGAVMYRETFLQYGWYLKGQRVEGCPGKTAGPEGEAKGGRKQPRRAKKAQSLAGPSA